MSTQHNETPQTDAPNETPQTGTPKNKKRIIIRVIVILIILWCLGKLMGNDLDANLGNDLDANFPDPDWRNNVTERDTELCLNDVIFSTSRATNFKAVYSFSDNQLKEGFAELYIIDAGKSMQTILETKKMQIQTI